MTMAIHTHINPLDVVPGFKHKGTGHVIQVFDSFGDLTKYLGESATKHRGIASVTSDSEFRRMGDFYSNTTFSVACDRVVFGDPVAGDAANKLIREIDNMAIATDKRVRTRSVAGGRPCVPAVVSGSMMPMRRRVTQKHDYAPLSVVFDVASSASVSVKALEKRGIALAALAKTLAAKRPINLYVMRSMRASNQPTYIALIKFPTNPIDIKRLAFCLSNQACARGMLFPLAIQAGTLNGTSETPNARFMISWPFGDHSYIGDNGSEYAVAPRTIGHDLAKWLKTDILHIPGIFHHSSHIAAIEKNAAQWVNDVALAYTKTKEI